jgi:hypothetical protein
MASETRPSSLGRRSVVARLAAVLALAACCVAVYFLVTSFLDDGVGDKRSPKDRQGKTEQSSSAQAPESYTVAPGDTLVSIAKATGVPTRRIERLNPDLDAETINAGQVLNLR